MDDDVKRTLDDDGVGFIDYADELRVGDIVWLDNHLCMVKFVHHSPLDLIHVTARDIFSNEAVIPFPMHPAHLVEVWEEGDANVR